MTQKKAKKVKVVEKPAETNSDKNKAIEVALQSLKKKFGAEVVEFLNKKEEAPQEIIPTGSLSLDAALGVGGIMLGRIYEFYGPNASGKTTLAISVLKEAIARGHRAVYLDAEHTLDPHLLEKMGVDTSRIMLVRAYTAEENLDIAESLMMTGEFSLCIVDSISALQPAAEANLESFSNNTMGVHPRLMARMCRTFTPLASRTKTALILINQIRANMSGYGNPETTSGGNAIPHHVSGRIRISGGGVKSRQIKDERGDVVGHKVTFEVTKNKLAAPFRSAEVDLIYGTGFHTDGELLDLSVGMGFVDQAGAWFSYNGEKIGQGRLKAIATIAGDATLKHDLTTKITELLGLAPPLVKDE